MACSWTESSVGPKLSPTKARIRGRKPRSAEQRIEEEDTMPPAFIEHYLIQAEDIEATKDWYVKVLGFRGGPHPDFKFPVYWLYLGDQDVLHLTAGGSKVSDNRMKYLGQESQATKGSGVIDHVAFRA